MMKGILLDGTRHWECVSCGYQHVSKPGEKGTAMHQCPNHAGAWVPLAQPGLKAHHRVNEREDYIGTDTGTTDSNGRIIQSVTTERADGEDCHIFAPCINYDWSQD